MSSLSLAGEKLRPGLRRRAIPFQGDVLSRIGLALLLAFAFLAIIRPLLPLGNPDAIGVGPRLGRPSWSFPAGTDTLGRSQLPRVVAGIRTTIFLPTLAVVVLTTVAVLVGMVAAYFPRVIGQVVSRSCDVLFSFPPLLLALLLIAIIGRGETAVVTSIIIIGLPGMTRIIRAAALRVVNRDFVMASRVGGASTGRLMLVHVLPNIAGTVMVQATLTLSSAILIESGLSFLGLGVQPPAASLGSLLFLGAPYLTVAPWLSLVPGVALALVLVAINLVGDGMRDVLDVRGVEVRR